MALSDMAPRLAAACLAFRDSERACDTERRRLISQRSDLERLVAHRDLQVIRSESRGRARRNAKYMAWRQRKLDRATVAFDHVASALALLERIPPGHFDLAAWQAASERAGRC